MTVTMYLKSKIKWLLTRSKAIRYGLRHVDDTAYISRGKHLIHSSFKMEAYSYIGMGSVVGPNVCLKQYAMVGSNVRFVGDDHVFDRVGTPVIFSGRPALVRPTVVGHDAWIGRDCLILAGCDIGDASVVAAGAVVTKDIPKGVIVGGVPAKIIGQRFNSESDVSRHLESLERTSIGSGGHYIAPSALF